MKDAKGHGSAGSGVAKDPAARARQLQHIQASMAAKRAAQSGEQHVAALADQHAIPTGHLKSGVDEQALADFGKWNSYYSKNEPQVTEKAVPNG